MHRRIQWMHFEKPQYNNNEYKRIDCPFHKSDSDCQSHTGACPKSCCCGKPPDPLFLRYQYCAYPQESYPTDHLCTEPCKIGFLVKIDIFLQKHAKVFDLYLELENGKSIGLFLQEMRSRNVKTETVETTKNKLPGKFSSLVVTLEVNHYNMRPELIDEIRNFDYVHYVEEM